MKMVEFWPQKKMELMNDRKKLNERKQRGNKKKRKLYENCASRRNDKIEGVTRPINYYFIIFFLFPLLCSPRTVISPFYFISTIDHCFVHFLIEISRYKCARVYLLHAQKRIFFMLHAHRIYFGGFHIFSFSETHHSHRFFYFSLHKT